MPAPGNVQTAHTDNFTRSLLPPPDAWPEFDYSADHLKNYPNYINAAEPLIDEAVTEGFGSKIAYLYEGASLTYRQLLKRSEQIARVLVEDLGLEPGNRVLLRSRNNPMLAACWLAVLKAGGICVTTMPLLRAEELSFILNRVDVRFALCEYDLAEELEKANTTSGSLKEIEYFTPMGVGGKSKATLDYRIQRKPSSFNNVKTAADDIALISFTSGTTGNPKAAAHFHRDILATCRGWPQIFPVERDDVISGSPTMAFTYGIGAFLFYPLYSRATAALVPFPSPQNILRTVELSKVTILYVVPTALNAMF
ncbi:MAG: AMP-binding protein, partial [Rhodospirillales bacterium]|nr:AMP-binding protein [Rhodospirillales bacterium]